MSHSLDTLDVPVTAAGRTLDDTDRQIVAFLQRDARMANAEIARRLGMAPSAIFDRIRKRAGRNVPEAKLCREAFTGGRCIVKAGTLR